MDDENELSPVEKLVLMARQTEPGEEPETPALRMVSFRVPTDLLASVQALASMTAQSRNTTMINLLEAGVYAVVSELDDDTPYHDIREHILGE
jgi:hypothetical protein